MSLKKQMLAETVQLLTKKIIYVRRVRPKAVGLCVWRSSGRFGDASQFGGWWYGYRIGSRAVSAGCVVCYSGGTWLGVDYYRAPCAGWARSRSSIHRRRICVRRGWKVHGESRSHGEGYAHPARQDDVHR